jgi:uncharacterized protein DUF6265
MSHFSKSVPARPHYSLPMSTRDLAAVCLALACAHAAAAQDRPDFSGTWVASGDSSAVGAAGKPLPPVWGAQFTIEHKGPALTLRRTFTGGAAVIAYTLDGSQTTSRMPGRLCEADSGATWTANWNGPAIVIAMIGALPANGKPIRMDVTATLRLESADTMRVDVAARVPNQAEPRVSSSLYKRDPAAAVRIEVPTAGTKATLAQVAWISGVWARESGVTMLEERWTPGAGGSMLGVSRTIRDGLQSAFEFLCIVERDGGLVYQAMPNGRSPATDFTLTKIDENGATFENPSHDFPKMIRYTRKEDGSLEAVISGAAGSKPVTFLFKRQP